MVQMLLGLIHLRRFLLSARFGAFCRGITNHRLCHLRKVLMRIRGFGCRRLIRTNNWIFRSI
jgi:hypothetical protein